MSSAPTGIRTPSWASISSARRWAIGTPRRWMPTRRRPSVPACFSTISWEMRMTARRISSAVMIRRLVIWFPPGLSGPVPAHRPDEGRGPSLRHPVDLDGHLGQPGPRRAAADREEVGLVHVDEAAARGQGAVVGDDPLEATCLAADDDDRPAR